MENQRLIGARQMRSSQNGPIALSFYGDTRLMQIADCDSRHGARWHLWRNRVRSTQAISDINSAAGKW